MGLDELVRITEEYRERMKVDGEAAVKDELRSLFDAHPKLTAVRWTQYTPHFNDGEPCTFSVHEAEVAIEGVTDGEEAEDEAGNSYVFNETYTFKCDNKGKYPADVRGTAAAVGALADKFQTCEDALEAAFGDHAEIIATRDAITVHEYEHD